MALKVSIGVFLTALAVCFGLVLFDFPSDSLIRLISNSDALISVNDEGVALGGHDPVAYFTDSGAVPGLPEVTQVHQGAVFRFSKRENATKFGRDPIRYLPRYGGFCALSVSQGEKMDTDGSWFSVVDGQLYLFKNKIFKGLWDMNYVEFIERADMEWKLL